MSPARNRAGCVACQRILTTAIFTLIAISNWQTATAEDIFGSSSSPTPDIFSKVMEDLNEIKEVAFSAPFFESASPKSANTESGSACCKGCSHSCSGGTTGVAVCPHLAHPEMGPLACSYEVRSTDVIPPVPNVEDYATPDAIADSFAEPFVDKDMINKLQSTKVTMEQGIDDYCQQMATLLSSTLSSDAMDSTQKTATIKSAMQLAVINAQIAAEAKIVKIKAAHESELAVMRGRLLQYSYIESNQQKIYQWLNPIYSNVNRNFQQIEKMATNSNQLKGCLDIISAQLQDRQTVEGKNQLTVTRRGKAVSPMAANEAIPVSRSTIKKVSNQFVQNQKDEDCELSPLAFQILELRLQQAENRIADLTENQSPTNAVEAVGAPTHRRASYDRLTPIAPLQPRR